MSEKEKYTSVYCPIANATAAIGAENPTIKLIQPAINPSQGAYILDKNLYSILSIVREKLLLI